MCRPTYGDMHDFRPICSPRERVPCSAPEVTPMPQSRLIATQLGTRVGPGTGIAWIFGQSALLAAGDAVTFNPQSARLLVPPYLALQLVAFFVFRAMRRETAAREALAVSNAELRGVAPILADSSRMAERLRITREL